MSYDDLARADRLARLLEADMSDTEVRELLHRASHLQPSTTRDRLTLADPAPGEDDEDEETAR